MRRRWETKNARTPKTITVLAIQFAGVITKYINYMRYVVVVFVICSKNNPAYKSALGLSRSPSEHDDDNFQEPQFYTHTHTHAVWLNGNDYIRGTIYIYVGKHTCHQCDRNRWGRRHYRNPNSSTHPRSCPRHPRISTSVCNFWNLSAWCVYVPIAPYYITCHIIFDHVQIYTQIELWGWQGDKLLSNLITVMLQCLRIEVLAGMLGCKSYYFRYNV